MVQFNTLMQREAEAAANSSHQRQIDIVSTKSAPGATRLWGFRSA